MKTIRVTTYTVTIKDTRTNKRRVYYKVSASSVARFHRVLAGFPQINETYAISDNPAVLQALALKVDIKQRPLNTFAKGDMLFCDECAFEVVKLNPKNIKLRRVAMHKWPEPDEMHKRFTTYTREELAHRAHPMTRQEAAQMIIGTRLVNRGQG